MGLDEPRGSKLRDAFLLSAMASLSACWGYMKHESRAWRILSELEANGSTLEYSLPRVCPVPGLPAHPYRHVLGEPTITVNPAGEEWAFRLEDGDSLHLTVVDARIARWSATIGQRALRANHTTVNFPGAPGARDRVKRYLRTHADVAGNVSFSMLHQCPCTGMTSSQLRILMGDTPAVATARQEPGAPVSFRYSAGAEGQMLVVDLAHDTVVSWRFGGPRVVR